MTHSLFRQRPNFTNALRGVLVATLWGVVACRPAGHASDDVATAAEARRAVAQRIGDWARWTAAGQIDSVADIFTADAWEADPGATPTVGRDSILASWRRAVTRGRWEFGVQVEEIVVNDSIAVERSGYTLKYTAQPGAQGPPSFVGRGHWVNLWRREADGQWRLRWTIATSESPAQGTAP